MTRDCFCTGCIQKTQSNIVYGTKLWDSKTEVLLIRPSKCSGLDPSITSLLVGESPIDFASSARDLGFLVTANDLDLEAHVSQVCRNANYQIRHISFIRDYLTVDATKTLVSVLVLSRLDFLNSLLCGCSKALLEKLQVVQNSAARLIFRVGMRAHVTPLRMALHWLPIEARIKFKLAVPCYNFFTNQSPSYISSLLTRYSIGREGNRSESDSRRLRSFALDVQTITFGHRAFSYCAPEIWNALPY